MIKCFNLISMLFNEMCLSFVMKNYFKLIGVIQYLNVFP